MKKIVWTILVTISGVVLLFSYRTSLGAGTTVASSTTGFSGSIGGSTGSGTSSSTTSGSAAAATPSASAKASASTGSSSSSSSSGTSTTTGLKNGTYTGSAASTRFGNVQVAITVAGGKITNVDVPQYPNGSGRDVEIANYSLPQLISETLSAQNANIDMVSGATYTSEGYLQSLQSAIDQAK
jgi:uncharacterized protein with FMN-binding domain